MAYMSQERKNELAPGIKAILKKYGVKGTLAVRNHMTLVLNIKSAKIDFIGNYNKVGHDKMNYGRFDPVSSGNIQVNPYHYADHFDGKAKDFLSEVIPAMKTGNWDNSDIMTDYFDVGWYIDVNIGQWDKPFQLEA